MSPEHDNNENTSLLLFAKSGTAAATSLSSTNGVKNVKPIGDLGMEAAAAARIKFRRASVNSLVNQTPPSSVHSLSQSQQNQQQQRAILIRREKSVCMPNKEGNIYYICKINKKYLSY